jgi:hypothetical protein
MKRSKLLAIPLPVAVKGTGGKLDSEQKGEAGD